MHENSNGETELRLELLGGLRVTRDGVPIARFVSAKAFALLAYLAVTGRPHSREALAGLLWAESAEDDARASLRVVLSNLRKLAGQHIVIGRDSVAFNRTSRYWLDVEAFEAGLRAAIDLYRGDFLEGFSVRDAPAFDEWLTVQRERLRQLAIDALSELTDRHLMRGDDAVALDNLRRLLALDPWREDAHRQLMLLLARQGQRSAALAQYEQCRQMLEDELGAEPEEETVALAEQIRAGTLVASTSPVQRSALPAPPTSVLGREDELERLAQLLTEPECRLITLVGPGGVGKTRLALEAATQTHAHFLDGACFVDLAPVVNPGLVAATIARALGQQETAGRSPDERLIDALRERDLLLLLDNFEQVIHAAPLVAAMLSACPRLTVLATSRSSLHLRGERQFPVQPLALPGVMDLSDIGILSANPAVALFTQRAAATQFDFAVTPGNAAAIAAICVRLEGLPLALELAAARVNTLPPTALLARLDHRLALLTTGAHDLPQRQQTLRGTISWSYNLLDAGQQRLFRCLGAFVGGGTLDAIQAVSDGEARNTDMATLDGVASLVDKSLAQRGAPASLQEDGSIPRYTMLETIREYALEQLEASGEVDNVRSRHAAYFLAYVEEAASRLTGADQARWIGRLDAEHDNLRAALNWSLVEANAVYLGLRLAAALWPFWEIRGYLNEGRRWLSQALQAAGQSGSIADQASWWANVLHGAGVLAQRQGDYPASGDYLNRSLEHFRQLGDERGVAMTLNDLGRVAQDQGDYVQARALYEQSLVLSRKVADQHCSADALAGLGAIAYWLAEYGKARSLLSDSLAIRRALGNKRGIGAVLQRLSYVMRHQGDLAEARMTAGEGLVLQRELGDQWGIAYSINTLGNVARDQGDYATAAQLLQESLELQRQLGDRQGVAYSLHQLGIVARALRDLPTAQRLAQESLEIFRELGHKRGIAYTLTGLGAIAREQGNAATARILIQESLVIQHSLGDTRGIASVMQEFVALAIAQGEPDRAALLLGAVAALHDSIGDATVPAIRGQHERTTTAIRSSLAQPAFETFWTEGQAMSLDQAVAYALAVHHDS